MNKLIAICGLNCETCEARLATINNDQALREKVAKKWTELNQVTILPEDINCEGCRMSGAKTPFCDKLCPIRQCALAKGVDHCGECQEKTTCNTIKMITGNNAEARERLGLKK